MNSHDTAELESTHRRGADVWLETHPLPTASNKTRLEGSTSLAAVGTDHSQFRVIVAFPISLFNLIA